MSIEMKLTSKKRDSSLDAICGLFIMYMIMGHASQWADIENDDFIVVSKYIMFMFMAWFFYKSGMFHKQMEFDEVIKRNVKKLLYPFVCYTIIGELIFWFYLYNNGILTIRELTIQPIIELCFNGSLSGNLPLWFLVSLFMVKMVVSYSEQKHIPLKYLLVICTLISWGGNR